MKCQASAEIMKTSFSNKSMQAGTSPSLPLDVTNHRDQRCQIHDPNFITSERICQTEVLATVPLTRENYTSNVQQMLQIYEMPDFRAQQTGACCDIINRNRNLGWEPEQTYKRQWKTKRDALIPSLKIPYKHKLSFRNINNNHPSENNKKQIRFDYLKAAKFTDTTNQRYTYRASCKSSDMSKNIVYKLNRHFPKRSGKLHNRHWPKDDDRSDMEITTSGNLLLYERESKYASKSSMGSSSISQSCSKTKYPSDKKPETEYQVLQVTSNSSQRIPLNYQPSEHDQDESHIVKLQVSNTDEVPLCCLRLADKIKQAKVAGLVNSHKVHSRDSEHPSGQDHDKPRDVKFQVSGRGAPLCCCKLANKIKQANVAGLIKPCTGYEVVGGPIGTPLCCAKLADKLNQAKATVPIETGKRYSPDYSNDLPRFAQDPRAFNSSAMSPEIYGDENPREYREALSDQTSDIIMNQPGYNLGYQDRTWNSLPKYHPGESMESQRESFRVSREQDPLPTKETQPVSTHQNIHEGTFKNYPTYNRNQPLNMGETSNQTKRSRDYGKRLIGSEKQYGENPLDPDYDRSAAIKRPMDGPQSLTKIPTDPRYYKSEYGKYPSIADDYIKTETMHLGSVNPPAEYKHAETKIRENKLDENRSLLPFSNVTSSDTADLRLFKEDAQLAGNKLTDTEKSNKGYSTKYYRKEPQIKKETRRSGNKMWELGNVGNEDATSKKIITNEINKSLFPEHFDSGISREQDGRLSKNIQLAADKSESKYPTNYRRKPNISKETKLLNNTKNQLDEIVLPKKEARLVGAIAEVSEKEYPVHYGKEPRSCEEVKQLGDITLEPRQQDARFVEKKLPIITESDTEYAAAYTEEPQNSNVSKLLENKTPKSGNQDATFKKIPKNKQYEGQPPKKHARPTEEKLTFPEESDKKYLTIHDLEFQSSKEAHDAISKIISNNETDDTALPANFGHDVSRDQNEILLRENGALVGKKLISIEERQQEYATDNRAEPQIGRKKKSSADIKLEPEHQDETSETNKKDVILVGKKLTGSGKSGKSKVANHLGDKEPEEGYQNRTIKSRPENRPDEGRPSSIIRDQDGQLSKKEAKLSSQAKTGDEHLTDYKKESRINKETKRPGDTNSEPVHKDATSKNIPDNRPDVSTLPPRLSDDISKEKNGVLGEVGGGNKPKSDKQYSKRHVKEPSISKEIEQLGVKKSASLLQDATSKLKNKLDEHTAPQHLGSDISRKQYKSYLEDDASFVRNKTMGLRENEKKLGVNNREHATDSGKEPLIGMEQISEEFLEGEQAKYQDATSKNMFKDEADDSKLRQGFHSNISRELVERFSKKEAENINNRRGQEESAFKHRTDYEKNLSKYSDIPATFDDSVNENSALAIDFGKINSTHEIDPYNGSDNIISDNTQYPHDGQLKKSNINSNGIMNQTTTPTDNKQLEQFEGGFSKNNHPRSAAQSKALPKKNIVTDGNRTSYQLDNKRSIKTKETGMKYSIHNGKYISADTASRRSKTGAKEIIITILIFPPNNIDEISKKIPEYKKRLYSRILSQRDPTSFEFIGISPLLECKYSGTPPHSAFHYLHNPAGAHRITDRKFVNTSIVAFYTIDPQITHESSLNPTDDGNDITGADSDSRSRTTGDPSRIQSSMPLDLQETGNELKLSSDDGRNTVEDQTNLSNTTQPNTHPTAGTAAPHRSKGPKKYLTNLFRRKNKSELNNAAVTTTPEKNNHNEIPIDDVKCVCPPESKHDQCNRSRIDTKDSRYRHKSQYNSKCECRVESVPTLSDGCCISRSSRQIDYRHSGKSLPITTSAHYDKCCGRSSCALADSRHIHLLQQNPVALENQEKEEEKQPEALKDDSSKSAQNKCTCCDCSNESSKSTSSKFHSLKRDTRQSNDTQNMNDPEEKDIPDSGTFGQETGSSAQDYESKVQFQENSCQCVSFFDRRSEATTSETTEIHSCCGKSTQKYCGAGNYNSFTSAISAETQTLYKENQQHKESCNFGTEYVNPENLDTAVGTESMEVVRGLDSTRDYSRIGLQSQPCQNRRRRCFSRPGHCINRPVPRNRKCPRCSPQNSPAQLRALLLGAPMSRVHLHD